MKAWYQLIASVVAFTLIFATPSEARRVALVIGNSAYQHVPELKNPLNDARDIAKTLKSIGFEDVNLKENLDYRAMRMALREFVQSSQGAELTFVFYAGHSIEVNKKNYLIPVDAKLNNAVDVDFEAIALDQVRTAASSASKLKMVILDACRNNPFKLAGRSGTRSVGRGLSIVEAKADELIAYSAKEGTTAQDGEKTRNSPFTTALLKNLKTSGVEVGVMFRQVRDDVLSATSNQQEPYTYASLSGDPIYLNGRPASPAPSTAPRPAYRAPPPVSKEAQEAATAWAATKDTTSVAVLKAFQNRYPGTVYSDMAAARASELNFKITKRSLDRSDSQTDVDVRDPTLIAKNCDRLAANPTDIFRNVPESVTYGLLKQNADAAIKTCKNASRLNPGIPRLEYQWARALQTRSREAAEPILWRLVRKNYPAAHDNLGWILYKKGNPTLAVRTFRKGANLGDLDSMVSLCEMMTRGHAAQRYDGEKLDIVRRAANAGHPSAVKAYQHEAAVRASRDKQAADQEQAAKVLGTFLGIVQGMKKH